MANKPRTIWARFPGDLAAKLERLAQESRRTQSDVLRILVEQASAEQLGKPHGISQAVSEEGT